MKVPECLSQSTHSFLVSVFPWVLGAERRQHIIHGHVLGKEGVVGGLVIGLCRTFHSTTRRNKFKFHFLLSPQSSVFLLVCCAQGKASCSAAPSLPLCVFKRRPAVCAALTSCVCRGGKRARQDHLDSNICLSLASWNKTGSFITVPPDPVNRRLLSLLYKAKRLAGRQAGRHGWQAGTKFKTSPRQLTFAQALFKRGGKSSRRGRG